MSGRGITREPRIALVVLNYNDSETTQRFIEGAACLAAVNNIVLVDNGSTDGSLSRLNTAAFPHVRTLALDSNGGYARGNNAGLRYAVETLGADYVFVANPDTRLSDDAVRAIAEFLGTHEDAGAVTCEMKSGASFPTDSGWQLPGYWQCVAQSIPGFDKLSRRVARPGEQGSAPLQDGARRCDAVAGSFFGISSSVLQSIGYLDDDTFLYYEENILGARLREHGKSCYVLSGYEYVHDHQVSILKSLPNVRKRLRIAEESREIYCKKYLDTSAVGVAFMRICSEIGIFVYSVIKSIFAVGRKHCKYV